MKPSGSFQPHIQLAHHYWRESVRPGDSVIDATCGNGHDTLLLCQLVLSEETGHVYAYDIQEQALSTTRKRLEENLSAAQINRVQLINGCHSYFSEVPQTHPVSLIVYNLGYLPGGNKACTTVTPTTVQSVQKACELIAPAGMISITCYPGHPAGALEEEALIKFVETLPWHSWNCCHHRRINRQRAPSLFILQKI